MIWLAPNREDRELLFGSLCNSGVSGSAFAVGHWSRACPGEPFRDFDCCNRRCLVVKIWLKPRDVSCISGKFSFRKFCKWTLPESVCSALRCPITFQRQMVTWVSQFLRGFFGKPSGVSIPVNTTKPKGPRVANSTPPPTPKPSNVVSFRFPSARSLTACLIWAPSCPRRAGTVQVRVTASGGGFDGSIRGTSAHVSGAEADFRVDPGRGWGPPRFGL